ncbi:MAG: hypothetical protein RJA99_3208 [Pseudomonadota bacterium]|jgi:hypothetical protein
MNPRVIPASLYEAANQEEHRPVVAVHVRDQYGTKAFHPANDAAHSFAAIAGTKTLTLATLGHVLKLGFDIKYIHPFDDPLAQLKEAA